MFTGIVQAVGSVLGAQRRGGGVRLSVRAPLPGGPLAPGESIAVDGVCLTVARVRRGGFEADLSGETLARSTAGSWSRSRSVNLERALMLGDRFGGHIVQGHVDGVGTLLSLRPGAGQFILRARVPVPLLPLIAEKGSIAVDGVSLTVAALFAGGFQAILVPHTLSATTLGERRAGDQLNIEVDLIARYVAQLLAGRAGRRGAKGKKRGR